MVSEEQSQEIKEIISEKISPYSLSDVGDAKISLLIRRYPYDLLIECIDIGIATYIKYDKKGHPTKRSVQDFIEKLGGIAYNKSRNPVDQELYHIKNICKKFEFYWDHLKANETLQRYVEALRKQKWSDEEILHDLKNEVIGLCYSCKSWNDWSNVMETWISDINNWSKQDDSLINQNGTILPTALFSNLSSNVQSICKQINASYENNLYDCTAVMMRRLLEDLLVLSYQQHSIEAEITESSGHHCILDKIIKNAAQNNTLCLSANTKKDMALFKDLGNFSAHKIWYNSTKQDIEPHILKYRVIIEELMYKAGLK